MDRTIRHRFSGRGKRTWPAARLLAAALGIVAPNCERIRQGIDWQDARGLVDTFDETGAHLTWLPQPQVPTDRTLYAGWGTEEGDLWAVGERGTVLHGQGDQWNRIDVPSDARLEGIIGFGPKDFFVVGAGGTVLHCQGASPQAATDNADGCWWIEEPTPTTTDLLDVWGTGPADLWAVGAEGTILHRDTEGWKAVSSGYFDRLGGLFGFSSDHVVAVGDFGTVLRWDGQRWQRDATVNTTRHLNDVWGTSSDNLYVVGLGGLVLHFADGAWSRIETDVAEYLRGVWGRTADEVYAVGWQGSVVRILEGVATRIVPQELHRLEGIFGGLGPHIFLLGSAGTILFGPTPPPNWQEQGR